jgi:hypothetical protein
MNLTGLWIKSHELVIDREIETGSELLSVLDENADGGTRYAKEPFEYFDACEVFRARRASCSTTSAEINSSARVRFPVLTASSKRRRATALCASDTALLLLAFVDR